VDGYADYAVIPVYNVIFGTVHTAIDAMAPFASLERLREVALPIRLSLLGVAGAKVEDVREALSHPVALAQCSRFLAEHPYITPVEAYDTAGAARMVAVRRDCTAAAIAGPWAAKHYRLEVIAEGLEDRADNATTFVLVRRRQHSLKE
jgi:prephenate dehydratase